jgi:UDP-N-acetylmuramate--alanine ligase
LNEQKGIAIAGAHGKTTTSSMTAVVMDECACESDAGKRHGRQRL